MFVILALFAANAVFALIVILPLYKKIIIYGNEIAEAQKKIATFDRRRELYLEIERAIKQEGVILRRVEDTALDINSPLPFIELIEELGREQGVSTKIQVRDAVKNNLQKFQIAAEGGFGELFQYLRVLEFAPYQISFLSIQLISSDETSSFAGELTMPNRKIASAPANKRNVKMLVEIAVKIKN